MNGNSFDFNSSVIQSTGITLGAGLGGFLLDQVFPAPTIITAPSQVPMVAAEIIAQLAVDQVALKLISDFLGQYSTRNTYLPLLGTAVFAMVQPNLQKKFNHLYQGLKLLKGSPYLIKTNPKPVKNSTCSYGQPDVINAGPRLNGPQINEVLAQE